MVGCLKVIKSPNENEKCRTFVLDDQDHTLGNALRYMVMKNVVAYFQPRSEVLWVCHTTPLGKEGTSSYRNPWRAEMLFGTEFSDGGSIKY
ncbi:RNA polymerases I and III subunit AC2 l(2)37Cg isoform X3 [Rhipicephalus microplus]|uniref:RNA polymerases I and III subunit AC2 l(2)37Cg isoform X3 n=1 Tax=Rhipicephalus microplus TaxID=6941 RepID=UPI003F6A70BA